MRLIDADAITEDERQEHGFFYNSDLQELLDEQPTIDISNTSNTLGALDCVSRQAAIEAIKELCEHYTPTKSVDHPHMNFVIEELQKLPSAQPDLGKYEYHYDHTDCIWYRPEARNRCPVTCAQYRDGWNDAMNYIFRDGKGYRPYRRGEQYEE